MLVKNLRFSYKNLQVCRGNFKVPRSILLDLSKLSLVI